MNGDSARCTCARSSSNTDCSRFCSNKRHRTPGPHSPVHYYVLSFRRRRRRRRRRIPHVEMLPLASETSRTGYCKHYQLGSAFIHSLTLDRHSDRAKFMNMRTLDTDGSIVPISSAEHALEPIRVCSGVPLWVRPKDANLHHFEHCPVHCKSSAFKQN